MHLNFIIFHIKIFSSFDDLMVYIIKIHVWGGGKMKTSPPQKNFGRENAPVIANLMELPLKKTKTIVQLNKLSEKTGGYDFKHRFTLTKTSLK